MSSARDHGRAPIGHGGGYRLGERRRRDRVVLAAAGQNRGADPVRVHHPAHGGRGAAFCVCLRVV